MPIFLPSTSTIWYGLIKPRNSGISVKSQFAQTMGNCAFLARGRSPSGLSSNSWFPKAHAVMLNLFMNGIIASCLNKVYQTVPWKKIASITTLLMRPKVFVHCHPLSWLCCKHSYLIHVSSIEKQSMLVVVLPSLLDSLVHSGQAAIALALLCKVLLASARANTGLLKPEMCVELNHLESDFKRLHQFIFKELNRRL